MLSMHEIGIEAIGLGEQLVVSAIFDGHALLQNNDLVGFSNRRESMCNGDGGSVLGHAVESGLHDVLAAHVDRAGGFVENEDGGTLDNASGNRQPLPLASTKLDAALSNLRIVSIW